jgi:hypothetical protein
MPVEPLATPQTDVCNERGNANAVEAALVRALEAATVAGRFDIIGELADELKARRLATSSKVVPFDARKRSFSS